MVECRPSVPRGAAPSPGKKAGDGSSPKASRACPGAPPVHAPFFEPNRPLAADRFAMAQPYLAEIRPTSFNFAPKGWALCNGQILQINQNQALFAILGTLYGGDGVRTFGLPDLRGRVPMHRSAAHPQGQVAGEEAHTLTQAEMPRHHHTLNASGDAATSSSPYLATPATPVATSPKMYAGQGAKTTMHPQSVSPVGGNQPHENVQPSLGLNFIIALQGIFPSQS
jgi:microcystin-dependent protein